MLLKTSLWATLVALFAVCGCEAGAGTIRPFQFSIPAREGWAPPTPYYVADPAGGDPILMTTQTWPETRRAGVVILAEGGWWSRVLTLESVARDSTIVIRGMQAPGGFCTIRVRPFDAGGIADWSPKISNVSLGF